MAANGSLVHVARRAPQPLVLAAQMAALLLVVCAVLVA